MNLNKVIVVGNITKTPELKTAGDTKVLQITLATNRVYKDKQGEKQEDTQFIDFVAFGKQAETLAQYCVKGQNMLFEGRIQNRSWDKEDGTKGYKTDVVLENFQFGNKPAGSSSHSNDDEDTSSLNTSSFNASESIQGAGYEAEEDEF